MRQLSSDSVPVGVASVRISIVATMKIISCFPDRALGKALWAARACADGIDGLAAEGVSEVAETRLADNGGNLAPALTKPSRLARREWPSYTLRLWQHGM